MLASNLKVGDLICLSLEYNPGASYRCALVISINESSGEFKVLWERERIRTYYSYMERAFSSWPYELLKLKKNEF